MRCTYRQLVWNRAMRVSGEISSNTTVQALSAGPKLSPSLSLCFSPKNMMLMEYPFNFITLKVKLSSNKDAVARSRTTSVRYPSSVAFEDTAEKTNIKPDKNKVRYCISLVLAALRGAARWISGSSWRKLRRQRLSRIGQTNTSECSAPRSQLRRLGRI